MNNFASDLQEKGLPLGKLQGELVGSCLLFFGSLVPVKSQKVSQHLPDESRQESMIMDKIKFYPGEVYFQYILSYTQLYRNSKTRYKTIKYLFR